MQTAIFGETGRWSLGRVSNTSLLLAFFAPALGIAFGSANGVPLDRLGGVIFVYWAFLLVSLLAAIWDVFSGSPKAIRRLGIVFVIAAVPVLTKVVFVTIQPAITVQAPPVVEVAPAQKTATGKGCQPEIVTGEPLTLTGHQAKRSGRIAWIFLVGNYYKWDFNVKITGNKRGAVGTAWADVESSAWYSTNLHPRRIEAEGQGSVECRQTPSGDKCDCFADGVGDSVVDEDFTLNVDVQSATTGSTATLKVSAAASLTGNGAALSEISVGKEPLGGKWQNPNTARGGISKTRSYSYRCVAAP